MSVVAFLDLTFTAETVAEALVALDEILEGTRSFEGNLGVETLVQADDPTRVIVVERWASMEADAAYRAWRAGDGASNLATFLAGAPTLTFFAPR